MHFQEAKNINTRNEIRHHQHDLVPTQTIAMLVIHRENGMRARNAGEGVRKEGHSSPNKRGTADWRSSLEHSSQSTLGPSLAEPFPTFDRLRVSTRMLLVQRASAVMSR
jgi:hypothetical protein